MTPAVWVLGNLTIDDVVLPDGTTAMGLCGGNAMYASLGARLWDERVGLAARIGPDYPVEHVSAVREAGVEFALVRVPSPSIHDWALYESENVRRFINWVGSGTHLEQSIRADELPAAISQASACHVAPMPLSVQTELVDKLAREGVGIVALDPHDEYIPGHEQELLDLLRLVTLFLPSHREAELLFGGRDPDAAARAFAAAGPKAVAIKLGADGSVVCVPGGDPVFVPAVRVRAIDPTGCGDAYCGGFVAAYQRGADPLMAACHGTVSASFVIEARGASSLLPFDHATARGRLEELQSGLSTPAGVAGAAGGSAYAHG
ncbi:MAG: carbohydrate kinase family protein [Candidatus Limnocylindria bacterium]